MSVLSTNYAKIKRTRQINKSPNLRYSTNFRVTSDFSIGNRAKPCNHFVGIGAFSR